MNESFSFLFQKETSVQAFLWKRYQAVCGAHNVGVQSPAETTRHLKCLSSYSQVKLQTVPKLNTYNRLRVVLLCRPRQCIFIDSLQPLLQVDRGRKVMSEVPEQVNRSHADLLATLQVTNWSVRPQPFISLTWIGRLDVTRVPELP